MSLFDPRALGGLGAATPAPAAVPVRRQSTPEEQRAAQAQAIATNTKAVWDAAAGRFNFVALSSGEALDRQLETPHNVPTNPNAGQNPFAFLDSLTPQPAPAPDPYAWLDPFTPGGSPSAALQDGVQRGTDNLTAGLGGSVPGGVTPPDRSAPAPTRAEEIRAGFTQELPRNTLNLAGAGPDLINRGVSTDPADAGLGRLGPTNDAKNLLTDAFGLPGGPGPAQPGDQAPKINQEAIDKTLNGLSGYEQSILDLGGDNTGLSVAEAQLNKSAEMAKIRARDELAANQAGALGAARGARNRGDRALLERQAIGEQAYLGSQSQRNDVLQQAELEGNLSILRATESEHDRQFKMEALKTAAGLGLNRAALEIDIGKVNLASATNWINNEAEKARQNAALDEQQYEALLDFSTNHTAQLLGFTQAMAAIQLSYDQMSVQDQQETDRLLMQKYGIDQGVVVSLKQIKAQGKSDSMAFFGQLAAGAITAGATVGGALIAGPVGAVAGATAAQALT